MAWKERGIPPRQRSQGRKLSGRGGGVAEEDFPKGGKDETLEENPRAEKSQVVRGFDHISGGGGNRTYPTRQDGGPMRKSLTAKMRKPRAGPTIYKRGKTKTHYVVKSGSKGPTAQRGPLPQLKKEPVGGGKRRKGRGSLQKNLKKTEIGL